MGTHLRRLFLEATAAMTHATKPRNRKERRAQTPTRTQPTIPLSQPSRSAPAPASTPKPKTLYEIAVERQQSFQQTSSPQTPPIRTSNNDPHTPHTTLRINPDGTLSTVPLKLSSPSGIKTSPITSTDTPSNDAANERDPLGLIASALFLSTTLSMLHFTLDVLVHHQYRQTIAWSDIRWRTAGALPRTLVPPFLPCPAHPPTNTFETTQSSSSYSSPPLPSFRRRAPPSRSQHGRSSSLPSPSCPAPISCTSRTMPPTTPS